MTELTPEQINLLTKLQPLFKEKMGEWQDGDEFYDTDPKLTRWSQQHGYVEVEMAQYFNKDEFLFCLRIPKPIDWQNENRGLLGMFSVPPILHFNPYLNKWCCERMHKNITKIDDYYAEDPFTALLKALCEQEGV